MSDAFGQVKRKVKGPSKGLDSHVNCSTDNQYKLQYRQTEVWLQFDSDLDDDNLMAKPVLNFANSREEASLKDLLNPGKPWIRFIKGTGKFSPNQYLCPVDKLYILDDD